MISLHDVTLRRGANVLLHDIDWTIYPKERIGIIGANGSGKSSLFALLLGELEADLGEVNIANNIRFAHVKQETPAFSLSALDYVLNGDEELRTLQTALQKAEEQDDGTKIANLHEKIHIIDGYTAEARAAQLLAGLNFSQEDQAKSVNEFSGGWRMRLNLAQALMSRSDVLLLDEPTNHLDLDTIYWLETWLKSYTGTLLLISHDREFLDGTVNRIAYLENQQLKIYAGNYSTFEKQRMTDLQLQQATYEKQQKAIAHMQSYVDKFRYKASKARQAQSRLKAIERMEVVSAVVAQSPFQFEFREPSPTQNPLIQLDHASVNYGDKLVLDKIDLSIARKERIGVLGPNGAGKSTLIKLIAGLIPPSAGKREKSAGLNIGYFAQHQVDALRLDETALMHMRDLSPDSAELTLRKFLGSFAFSGNKVQEPIANFSGGEKSRLALALLVWQKPNLLLLDEPTNHLDLDMRNALSVALQDFAGAMILVSHDRFLVRTTTDKLLLVANRTVSEFDGDLNDYQNWLTAFRKGNPGLEQGPREDSKKEKRKREAAAREARRPLLEKIKKLENDLNKLRGQLTKIEEKLADSSLYETTKKAELEQHLLNQTKIKKEIANVEQEWLDACNEDDNQC